MINADTIKNKSLLTYKNQYGDNVQCTAISTNGMTVMVILPDGSQCEIPCTSVTTYEPQPQPNKSFFVAENKGVDDGSND